MLRRLLLHGPVLGGRLLAGLWDVWCPLPLRLKLLLAAGGGHALLLPLPLRHGPRGRGFL